MHASHVKERQIGGRPESLAQRLNLAATRSAEYSHRHFRLIGLLTTLIPAAYLADYYVGKPYFDTLAIRVVAFVLAIPLILHDRKPFRDCSHFHLYYVSLAAYALPFSFGFMLILNAAAAPQGMQIEEFWILQYLVALFLFIQLIHNGLLSSLLWCISTLLAFGALVLVEQINWDELKRVAMYPFTVYLTALVFGLVTNRNADYVDSEKLRAASAIGSNIAHELRTPLASIRSLAHAVNKNSQTLVDTYIHAKAKDLHTGDLTSDQVAGLRAALTTIEQEVAYSNTIIDMLLLNTSERAAYPAPQERFNASEAAAEAIRRFPFNNSDERALTHLKVTKDFQVQASRLMVVHVLFNLIKNGIYYTQKSTNGSLEICIGAYRHRPCIEVIDTGPGISPSDIKYVFDRFYTTSNSSQGAGIGLSFCRSFMESIGGEIQCESKKGRFTTFRLVFPKPDQDGLQSN